MGTVVFRSDHAFGRLCGLTTTRAWHLTAYARKKQIGAGFDGKTVMVGFWREELNNDGNAYAFVECWDESNAGSGFADDKWKIQMGIGALEGPFLDTLFAHRYD